MKALDFQRDSIVPNHNLGVSKADQEAKDAIGEEVYKYVLFIDMSV